MDLETKRKEVIDFLRKYNLDSTDYKSRVVLAAPAHGNPNEIRVYMNGGNVGKIAINENGVTTGINSKQYSNKHKGIVPGVVHILEKNSGSNELSRLDALMDPDYLKYAQEATTTYSVKNDNDSDKERTIETLIMDYRNQQSGNASIDMEMQYSVRDHFGWTRKKEPGHKYLSTMAYKKQEWYNEEDLLPDLTETRSPRVDLMVLNDNGIGFVELKVDNENCQNLSSHIIHMNYILSHQEVFIKDANRRLSALKKYGLLEPEMTPNIEKWERDHQIWCGILFVGKKDRLSEAKRMVKKELNTQNIRCCFVDTSVIKDRRLNMRSEIFVSDETFVSPNYKGES